MKIVLIILLLITNTSIAQSDSSSIFIMGDSGYIHKSDPTFRTIDRSTFYFNGIKDVKVYNKGKRFYS